MKPDNCIEIIHDDCRFDVDYSDSEIQGVWIGTREILRFLDSKEIDELEKATKALIKSHHEPQELPDYICS
jgi:hypothetical protein